MCSNSNAQKCRNSLVKMAEDTHPSDNLLVSIMVIYFYNDAEHSLFYLLALISLIPHVFIVLLFYFFHFLNKSLITFLFIKLTGLQNLENKF